MTNVQSKLLPVYSPCKDFVHPWTDSCWNATAGLLIQCTQHSLRIYTVVYALSLLMRHRIPNLRDIKRTFLGIIQSTAFLTTNGFAFFMFTCFLRNLLGKFFYPTVTFVPAYLASLAAIYIERPVRRPLLCLYVANVATETLWRMAESRGLVKSIPNGQAIIFGLSVSFCLYIYRLGLHENICKDSLFSILRVFVGKGEEGPLKSREELPSFDDAQNEELQGVRVSQTNNYGNISSFVQTYLRLIDRLKGKHITCPHKNSCSFYTIMGGIKPFIAGVGLQVALKLVLQFKKLIQFKLNWRKAVFNKDTLKLGIFMGGFSFLYKAVSCLLRHSTGFDDPMHAVPAGLIASIAFTQYPDTTVALYVMWKSFQILYNIGIEKGLLPKIPGFTIFLYCLSTATLFHAAMFEPLNLRPSYWKFLHSLSGARVGYMDRNPFECWGLESTKAVQEVLKRTGTADKAIKFLF